MLEQTFLHLPGVGASTERRLWQRGISTWAALEAFYEREPTFFPDFLRDKRVKALQESAAALSRRDTDYFAERLPPREHYRIAETFPGETVFLDIETTGLSIYYDKITLVGVSRTNRYACYLPGTRDKEWREILDGAKCLVTFNGTGFDLKFLARDFPKVGLPRAHVDLRYLGRRVGLSGPQKDVEKQLGIGRSEGIKEVRGIEAALLWYEYKAGDVEAGRRLIQYNHADVEGMKVILDESIRRLVKGGGAPVPMANGTRFSNFRSDIQFAKSREAAEQGKVHVPRFRGRKGPRVNFADLEKTSSIADLRVVGIDLTGSAKRPTGWCLLNGRRAETRLLRTDREIVEATREADPDLVSIDSPLSLPRGRRTVRDNDRGRQKFGIMRECERILKRRGINVYPCLIPSMQGLTKRGMLLAKKLRSLGIPVIESYPGAAQDIMSIPRKRASLVQLMDGLRLFGIKGDFIKHPVSHDELDAITSAVVGLFHWSGKFEALGNNDEDYLIIPDLNKETEEWRGRRVVGISGPIAAGKTTAARHLETKGFAYGRYSVVLANLLINLGRKADRVSLQELGDRIHFRPGQRWLSRELLEHLPKNRDLVIDGLRWPEDHAFWVEQFGPAYVHLHVDAILETRKRRYIEEGHSDSEFDRAVVHRVEQKVPIMRDHADVLVRNDHTRSGIKRNIVRAINKKFSARELPCQFQSS